MRNTHFDTSTQITIIPSGRKSFTNIMAATAIFTLCTMVLMMSAAKPTLSPGVGSNPVIVNQVGGLADYASAKGNYAFFSAGPRMVVFDVTDPINPIEVARTGILAGPSSNVHDIALQGDYAYVGAGDNGLIIFDVSTPSTPVRLGSYDTPYDVRNVAASGPHAYLTDVNTDDYPDCEGAMRVINVSDPYNPWEEGAVARSSCGFVFGVAFIAQDNYVYDYNKIYDVSEPASPFLATQYIKPGATTYGVAIVDHYAYYAFGPDDLFVVDVSDPSNLIEVYQYPVATYDVYIEGDQAYLNGYGYDYGMKILDISDPTAPVPRGSLTTSIGTIQDVENGVAFAPDTWYSEIVDVSDPDNPSLLEVHKDLASPWTLSLAGDFLYVADERGAYLDILNVTDRENPVAKGDYDTPVRAWDVKANGCCAFVAAHNYSSPSGLYIIDVTDPLNPWEVTLYGTPGDARTVAVDNDNHAFIVDTTGPFGSYVHTLIVLDITDLANPIEISSNLSWQYGEVNDMEINGDYLYIVRGSFLHIVDISNPASPTEVGVYQSTEYSWAVDIFSDYAYFAGGIAGLRIVNISDPTNPVEVGHANPGRVFGVNYSNNHVYVASQLGLRIYDVADPTNPLLVSAFDDVPGGYDVVVDGDFVYYASNFQGIFVLHMEEDPPPPTSTPTPIPTSTPTSTPTPTATPVPEMYWSHLPALLKSAPIGSAASTQR